MRYAEVPVALQARVTPGAGARIVSLDALRGFNFFWILGGDGVMWALQAMLHDKGPVLSALGDTLGTQFSHAPWDGFHVYDLIFPLFIFITGVTMPFSLPKQVAREGRLAAHEHVIRRVLLLYVLGVIYYGGISHGWHDIRFLGVLQRIAICYLVAALMFLNFNWRVLAVTFVALLIGYWALIMFVPVPCCGAGSLLPEGNLPAFVDALSLPGRLWDRTTDPEGLLSTLPAIATCLAGVLAGELMHEQRVPPQQKVYWLIGAGLFSIALAYLWAPNFPVIKYLWTSSYVLLAGGWSALLLAAFYQVIDIWGYKRWATVFVWIGANAILLYFVDGVLGFEPFALRFVGGDVGAFFDRTITPGAGTLVAYLVGLGFVIATAGFLYRRKLFLHV
jgi:predicted acyltransferase